MAPRETLPDDFQPHIYDSNDGTILRRVCFTPPGYNPSDNTKYPTVISIPPTVFRSGEASGVPSQRTASRDLARAGFLVFQVEHRLAPPGLLEGQTRHSRSKPEGIASGRPPQQTNDIKQQILAALADGKCNQKIYLVGGSSGGCHALWVALDPASGNITAWNLDVVKKIKAVVSLSGPTNLPSREGDPEVVPDFEVAVENYTNARNGPDPDWYQIQYNVSPIKLVENATYFPPIRMYATEGDTVPFQQGEDMKQEFDIYHPTADVNFYKINDGSSHAFNYWHEVNEETTDCVSAEVIAFLQAHL